MKIIQFEQKWEESIVQLWNQCCTKDLITIEQFRKKILFDENFDSELCWIAIEENSAIGFLLAIKRKFPYLERGLEKERGWISVMFVSPDYQRQGIGNALLKIAEEKLVSLGVNEITLAAYSPNYFFSGIDEENYSEYDWYATDYGILNMKFRCPDGTYDYAKIESINAASETGSQLVMTQIDSKLNTYGLTSTYSSYLTPDIEIYAGLDVKYFVSAHTNRLVDLFGGDFYVDPCRGDVLIENNMLVTDEWVNEIREAFGGVEVLCDDLSMGVSCHIGPGGLGIGCSCRPDELHG